MSIRGILILPRVCESLIFDTSINAMEKTNFSTGRPRVENAAFRLPRRAKK